MQARVRELNSEMKQATEEKAVIQGFIEQQEGKIPAVVLDILQNQILRLNVIIEDCELRLKNYE